MSRKGIDILYHKVGLNNNLRDIEVANIIESQYAFVKETIDDLALKDITEEEFDKLKTNFIFKYLGKLHTNYNIIKKSKIISETYKKIHKDGRSKRSD